MKVGTAMVAQILDGTAASSAVRRSVRTDTEAFLKVHHFAPCLAVLIATNSDLASVAYSKAIGRACSRVGITYREEILPRGGSTVDLCARIELLNRDETVHGVIIQMPLPAGYDATTAIRLLDPRKDVDGVTPVSAGLLALGRDGLRPATPQGGIELIDHFELPIAGVRATVVGRSVVIGRPLALMLIARGATVTVCHTGTRDLSDACRGAEVLWVAAGRPGLIDASMVANGAIVVDFGTTVDHVGQMQGDVDFVSVSRVASWITPVPGGTLPMTTSVLLKNTLAAARGLTGHG